MQTSFLFTGIYLVYHLAPLAKFVSSQHEAPIEFDPLVHPSYRSGYAALVFHSIATEGFDAITTHKRLPQGWMYPISAYAVAKISHVQRSIGITGGIGEIGVHYGLFFIALAHTASRGEHLFACDVFAEQGLNVDNSGAGDRAVFERYINEFGVAGNLWIYEGASSTLSIDRLFSSRTAPFRLLSIDGGHSATTTFEDLRLAERILIDGGVVVLDDFNNDMWMGVREGFFRYMFQERDNMTQTTLRLAPFLLAGQKLYLTTESHHHHMLETFKDDHVFSSLNLKVLPESEHHGGLTALAGWQIGILALVSGVSVSIQRSTLFTQAARGTLMANWHLLLHEGTSGNELAPRGCWMPPFQPEVCCNRQSGPRGHEACWTSGFTYEICCPSTCWSGLLQFDLCCDVSFGPAGYEMCWTTHGFSYDVCCQNR